MQVFAKALGLTEAELFKQMETGKVLAAETLPKVAKAYREAAKEGGAYELALKGLRVAEGRMLTDAQRAGKNIFQGGFSEGMAKMYESITDMLKSSEPQLKKLGKVFGMVFEAIAKAIDIVTPVLKLFIDNLGVLVGATMVSKIMMMRTAMQSFGVTTAAAMATILIPLTKVIAAMGVVDEFMANFDKNKISMAEKTQGYQVIDGRRVGIVEKDGNYYKGRDMGEAQGFEKIMEMKNPLSSGKPREDTRTGLEGGIASILHSNPVISATLGSGFDALFAPTPTSNPVNSTNTVVHKVKVDVDVTGTPESEVPNLIATSMQRGYNDFVSNGMVPHTR